MSKRQFFESFYYNQIFHSLVHCESEMPQNYISFFQLQFLGYKRPLHLAELRGISIIQKAYEVSSEQMMFTEF